MKTRRFYPLVATYLAAFMMLGGALFAQPVDIPDLNLRVAIEETLGHDRITEETLRGLEVLDATNRNISDLTGLELAVNMKWLFIGNNEITDLAPLSRMGKLETLHIYSNPISDISPLSTLINLKYIHAGGCEIADISALAKLTQLTEVNLAWNRITDITSLVNLSELKRLEIHNNPIIDYQILNELSLDHVEYDQSCDMSPLPLQPRLDNRSFPSVFSAWGGIGWSSILNQSHLSDMEQMAQHDLYFCCPIFNQYFLDVGYRWEIRGHISDAIQIRDDYIKLNANMIFLVGVSMKEGTDSDFPPDSPYWVRNADGSRVPGWPGTYLVDFTHPDIQDRIVEQALAIARCGLYDGLMFDWWHEDHAVLADGLGDWSEGYIGFDDEQKARDNILERIRSQVRSSFLILVNTNRSIIPRTAPHINGSFMETLTPSVVLKYSDGDSEDEIEHALLETEESLRWLEDNLREPRINSLEGWGFPDEPPDSPRNRRWMRAFTALSLTHSDGYVLFNDGIQHAHYWYDFWDADLGRPVGEKGQLYQDIDGLYIREFTNGWAVYNHSGAPQAVTLPEKVQGVASGWVGTEHALPNLDGEMYLRVTPVNPADVNGDGIVNILDLTLVAQALGTAEARGDVNGDGVVNVFDLVMVAEAF